MSDPRIERILGQSELPPAALADVRTTIDNSPYLQAVMLKAIDEQRVRHFSLSKNEHEGGHYDRTTRTISINSDYFRIKNREDRLDGLTSVIGHEVGHALMARSAELTEYRYAFEVENAIRNASWNDEIGVDITPFARHAVDDFRKNEALAELVSMNSLASRIASAKGGFQREDFLARADTGTECIDNGKLDAGIRLNAKGYQSTGGEINSPAVERIAVCRFDNGARTLGLRGTSNYDDTYAAYTLGAAADIWKDYGRGTTRGMPQIEVNLGTLRTSKQGVEDAGIDLGGKGKAFDFIDLSSGQRRAVVIQQLGDASKQQPDAPIAQMKKPLLVDNSSPTDDPPFNDVFFALHSHNEVAIQDALKRMMNTPEAHAIQEQGRTALEAKQQQEVQAMVQAAELNPELAVAMAPKVEAKRGPVMVMSLLRPSGLQGSDMGGGGGG